MAWVVLGVVVILVAVAWVTGGLRGRSKAVAAVRPGGTVDQGAFRVRVLDARAGRMKSNSFDKPANTLVVRMLVDDRTHDSYGIGTFLKGSPPNPSRNLSSTPTP